MQNQAGFRGYWRQHDLVFNYPQICSGGAFMCGPFLHRGAGISASSGVGPKKILHNGSVMLGLGVPADRHVAADRFDETQSGLTISASLSVAVPI
jgi:hypothetical protein